jgi:AcrR family transcriptional regulator
MGRRLVVASVSGVGSQGPEERGLASKERERGGSVVDGQRPSGGKTPGAEPLSRPVGRPRSADADEAILAAARELLAERGWDGMTLGDVAARAGVAKTTLYRRWSGKAELVVDAMAQLFDTLESVDAGSSRADAEATIKKLIALLARPETQAAVLALAAHAARDLKLRAAVREKIVDRQRHLVREGAARAAARGESGARVEDPDLMFDIIVGTMMHRMLIAGDPVDDDYLQRFLDVLLVGNTGPGPANAPTSPSD